MNAIVRSIDTAGRIGFDEFGQLLLETPHPNEPTWIVSRSTHDLRNATCAICGRGWELTAEAWSDHQWWYVFEEHVHETCAVRLRNIVVRDRFRSGLIKARARFERIVPVANRYWARGRRGQLHWFEIDLLDHPVRLTLGERKRVTHIEATPTEGELGWWSVAKERFASEDVTKHFAPDLVYLHAWKDEDERTYLTRLMRIIEAQQDFVGGAS